MKKNSFNNTLKEIKNYAHMIKEAYVYSGEEGEMPQEEMPQEEGIEDNGDVLEIIMSMRELALNGIQAFKDNVDDPKYEFFKKIFLETDKVLTEKEEGAEQ